MKFDNVSVETKANVYFDGKVVSHAFFMPDGEKKTFGIIYPGDYCFDTATPETMEITGGTCTVRLKGETEWQTYTGGSLFKVPANSSFEISVSEGIAEYVCSYK